MLKWTPLLCICLLFACKDSSKDKSPDALAKDEMPAYIQQLFTQTAQHPDSIGLRMQLVDALDSLGAYQQANGQMDSLIKNDSLNYGLWYRKGLVQQNAKDTTGALRSFRYAIRIYPAPDAILAAANLFAEKKDTTALMLARNVAGMRLGREYDAHSYFITGVYYARTGDKKKAMDAFNACIYQDRNYMEAYMEKGFLFYDAKKIQEALQVFQSVVTIKSTYADGYYWMAKCYEAMNNPTAAADNYKRTLNLDPGIKEAEEGLKRVDKN